MVLCIVTSSKFKPALFLCLSGILAGCAQGPLTAPQSPVDTTAVSKTDDQPYSARELYQLARNYQAEPQQYHLLKAARQALAEQDYLLALAITENLKQSPYPLIRHQNMLPRLQAYLATEQQHSLMQLLDKIEPEQIAQSDRAEFMWLAGQYQSQQQRYLAACRSLLLLEQQDGALQSFPQYPDLLWQNLSALSDSQLEGLRTGADYNTAGWLNLALLSRRYIGQPEALQQAFADWQRRYPTLPALSQLPDAVRQLINLTPYQPKRVAVLLPLQGQFRPHAQAIQYGILAAASNKQTTSLVFIDSQQSPAAMQQQVEQAQAEFVIGPLLKDQVDSVSKIDNWPWPTLFLNSKDNNITKAEQFYFALSMEDEASQMAQLFAQKNYRRPVVISSANNISVRMQQHFAAEWHRLGNDAPEMHQFNSKEELESLINSLLETDRSRERVKQISALLSQKLEADPHSRLDIDAIYLIADPVQTRLFKPFVDVSVSQTAPRLPVYASSRSHSTSLDSTDQRDLNGLTFTEMPWMLSEQSSVELRQQYQQLFADQDETLQRLFAMGYDAYQLVGSLRQQQQLPATVFPGLTGQLRLTPEGSIVRQLSWASYRNNRLRPVQEP